MLRVVSRQQSKMMKLLAFTLALLLTLSLVSAEVLELTEATFDGVVKDPSKNAFCAFTAGWCGHCARMKPAYKELSEDSEVQALVTVANLDADVAGGVAAAQGIEGFPTIKLFTKSNKDGIEYSGARTKDAMKAFIKANVVV
jgi:protein disulfide-isomerase-like protein